MVSNDCFFFLLAAFFDFILFFSICAARHTITVSDIIQVTYLMSSLALLHVVCHDNFGLKVGGPMLAAKFGPPGTIILQLPDI